MEHWIRSSHAFYVNGKISVKIQRNVKPMTKFGFNQLELPCWGAPRIPPLCAIRKTLNDYFLMHRGNDRHLNVSTLSDTPHEQIKDAHGREIVLKIGLLPPTIDF